MEYFKERRKCQMSGFKEDFAKGFVDGLKEAEYEKNNGPVAMLIRNLLYDPRQNNNPVYREGFAQGVEEGGGWCNWDDD